MPSSRSDLRKGHTRSIALAIGVLAPTRNTAIGSSGDGVGTASGDLNKRPGRRVALSLVVVAPTHHRAIETDGERMFLSGGHCGEQSVRCVQYPVGVGSPTHQRSGLLTHEHRGSNNQSQRREDHVGRIFYDHCCSYMSCINPSAP